MESQISLGSAGRVATSNRTFIHPEDKWPKQLGERYAPSGKYLSYKDIVKDYSAWERGWIRSSKYLPANLDLCALKGVIKEIIGWWDGSKWVGYRVRKGQTFEFWKKSANPHGVYGNHLLRKE